MWDRDRRYTRIKLCEFEWLDPAYEASLLGVDVLGFHLFQHQDLSEKVGRFRSIFAHLAGRVATALLTDLAPDTLLDVLEVLPADCVQLYPDWDVARVRRIRRSPRAPRILKVLGAQPRENFEPDHRAFFAYYEDDVDGFLLDSFRAGGTGLVADWGRCASIVRMTERPVFLAGGLTAENVATAIRVVRPFGVDVESGVSIRIPGGPLVKSLVKCRGFVAAVAGADRDLAREEALDRRK